MIVCGAELCSDRILTELVTVAAPCRVRLWLVADNATSEPLAHLAEEWPTVHVSEDSFDDSWTSESGVGPDPKSDCLRWVPDSDFVVFLSDVAEFLPADEATAVEGAFRSDVAAFGRLLEDVEFLNEDTVTELVRDLLAGCVTVPAATNGGPFRPPPPVSAGTSSWIWPACSPPEWWTGRHPSFQDRRCGSSPGPWFGVLCWPDRRPL